MIDPAPSRILSRMGTRRFATGAQPVVIFFESVQKFVRFLGFIYQKRLTAIEHDMGKSVSV